jgi:hypothetical protein
MPRTRGPGDLPGESSAHTLPVRHSGIFVSFSSLAPSESARDPRSAESIIIGAPAPPVGCHFVTISAQHRAAPTAMVRFRLVPEPEYAGLVFAAFHKSKIGRG